MPALVRRTSTSLWELVASNRLQSPSILETQAPAMTAETTAVAISDLNIRRFMVGRSAL